MPLGRKDKDQSGGSGALQSAVDRLSSLSVVAVAVDVMAKAFTGEPASDPGDPPWPDPFGRGPSAYEVANWLYLPHDEELDASQLAGRTLCALVSEALQALEHASLVRSHLAFGFQGRLADASMQYVLTRYGVSVRDAGTVERTLSGGTSST
jgi:hypothetical protein